MSLKAHFLQGSLAAGTVKGSASQHTTGSSEFLVHAPIRLSDTRRFRQRSSHVCSPRNAVSNSVRDQADALAAAQRVGSAPDEFVEALLSQFRSHEAETSPALTSLRESSSEVASRMRFPTFRDEAFRFTDVKPLKALTISLPAESTPAGLQLSQFSLKEADGSRLVVVDGRLDLHLSKLDGLGKGVTVGPLSALNDEQLQRFVNGHLGVSGGGLDLFSALNGAAASDVAVIGVPADVSVDKPIHIVYVSTHHDAAPALLSSPRLLVVVEEGGQVEVVEEFVSAAAAAGSSNEGGSSSSVSWVNSVMEVSLAPGARLVHAFIQEQPRDAFLTRHTLVTQAANSSYELVEAQLGSRLSRHSLTMSQQGPETNTELYTFALCGARQLQDLHSSMVLDHPRGVTRQIHKCIVTDASGHGVFDGNVRVNRYAQQTDAGQLSRSLLLAPRGTINVKPNLQIIADDVKCTHGAAISDLEEEQLFYFRARGIDESAARSALVFSFGAEVVEKLPYDSLRKRIEGTVKSSLLAQGAMDSSVAAGLSS